MLMAPEYAGYVHDKHTEYELVDGKHEALISVEVYQRDQALLKSANNTRSGEKHYKVNELYDLRGTLLCSNCHKPMYGSAPRTGNKKAYSPRYHCARSSCRGKVSSVKADLVHLQFTRRRTNILKKFVEEQISLEEKNSLTKDLDDRKETLQLELNELTRQQSIRE